LVDERRYCRGLAKFGGLEFRGVGGAGCREKATEGREERTPGPERSNWRKGT
jgi:hypothetical protein